MSAEFFTQFLHSEPIGLCPDHLPLFVVHGSLGSKAMLLLVDV